MKFKPAFLLIALAIISIAFLSFLLNQAEKEKVCCREKPSPAIKIGNSEEIPVNSLNHLIASTL
jgi:hypothetical protein